MKIIEFRVVIDLGDKIGTDIDIGLTDEEYEQLLSVKNLTEDEQYIKLENILEKVREATIDREVKYIKEDPSLIENYIHDDEDLEQLQEQGYRNFVDCLDDAALTDLIESNASFDVKIPEVD